MNGRILGIDPVRASAGYAVLASDDASVLELGIATVETLLERARTLVKEHEITAVALGTGTNAGALGDQLAVLGVPVRLVDERETTLKARALYFADHPPRGWRRLLPLGMQLPPRPIDDYAAVLIGRRYLEESANSR